MRKLINPLLAAVMLTTAAGALAAQKDITVNATIDSQIDLTQADNTPLPASIEMQYLPGVGLSSYRLNTKFWANSPTENIKVRLINGAQLHSLEGGKTIPMTVSLGDKPLSTADVEFTGSELFPGTTENGSAVLPLIISQTQKGILETGQYSGVVSLMLAQSTTAQQ